MAPLGGATRLWGPLLGAVPLFLLFEWLSANFPNHYSILLGVLFIVIVFLLPRGILSRAEELWRVGWRAARKSADGEMRP
jgi:branched-chain amino acid transport system permease protein